MRFRVTFTTVMIASLFSACSLQTTPPFLDVAKQVTMESAVMPPILGILRAAITDELQAMPYVNLIYGRTACAGYRGVNPIAILGKNSGPVVGLEWRCLFVTSACPIPSEPDWPAWIITSTRPLLQPIDWTPFGARGCWLLVSPDQIVIVPPVTSGMFIRSRGQTTLVWTPSSGSVGMKHWFQFLTLSPTGFLASQGVEVTVGSQM